MLDEWQEVPAVLGAVKRAVDDDPRPGRFILTGNVRAELETDTWRGTGRLVRLRMYGFTERELRPGGPASDTPMFLDRLGSADLDAFARPRGAPDLRDYIERAVRGGFPAVALAPHPTTALIDSYVEQLLSRDSREVVGGRDEAKLARYFEDPSYLAVVLRKEQGVPLIIAEDCDEYLAGGTRHTDRRPGRLLNLTDGLPGMTAQVLVLITSNAPLGTIHPAVVRPGRCLAQLEFAPLDRAEAQTWLAARGVTSPAPAGATLADLYELLTPTSITATVSTGIGDRPYL